MASNCRYFYVLSFMAVNDSGLAIVIASDENEAFQILKNQGEHNAQPGAYMLSSSVNLGQYEGGFMGLVFESYTNALVAYKAISDMIPDDLMTLESRMKEYVDEKIDEVVNPKNPDRVIYTFKYNQPES